MRNTVRGFTLIEMMVSVTLFSIVMLVGLSALLTLVNENQRAQALNSVITDLNFTLESMARTIRVGNQFDCGGPTLDCDSGSKSFSFRAPFIESSFRNITYRFNDDRDRGVIQRSVDSGGWVDITSSNVDIEDFSFYVFGAERAEAGQPPEPYQPRVMMVLSGKAAVDGQDTEFSIQTTVTQRVIDL